ncbi:transposase [Rhizobium sp. ZW T2_16]|uniref:transposase n=1 Tax=Rhizobium sp. ZW T2_16 TaxID=3378083 RepID=UPI00385770F3
MVEYCNRDACRSCDLKQHCTKGGAGRKRSGAGPDGSASAARPEVLNQRRESVEHPFGTIKQWMYQGAFLTRRLENVRGEFSLTALAYNIRRAITLAGVPDLIAAVRA